MKYNNLLKIVNNYYLMSRATRPIPIPNSDIEKLKDIIIKQLFLVFNKFGSLTAPNGNLGTLRFEMKNPKEEAIDITLALQTDRPNPDREEEVILGADSMDLGSAKRKLIRVFINSDLSLQKLQEKLLNGSLRLDVLDNIIHELTHALDISGKGGAINTLTDINSPGEVRARMAELARFHLEDVKRYLSSGLSFAEAFNISMNNDDVWSEMEPQLNQKNKNTILKGIWTYIKENL